MTTFSPRPMTGILAPNATDWERPLAAQVDHLLGLDIPIRDLWNPWRCPERFLPYLAWTLSVDLWESAWPETKRRSVIANAIRHHAMKGTLGGIKAYLDLVDVGLAKATTPPAKVFSGPSLTKTERERWLADLPQIRVWRSFERSERGKRIFTGGGSHRCFLEGRYPGPNEAVHRMRRRARWVVDGVETEARVEGLEGGYRIFQRATRASQAFSGRIVKGGVFFLPSTAGDRIVTVEPVSRSPWRAPVGPHLTPVASEPEIVAQPGQEAHEVYSGRPFGSRYYVPSRADHRLFERYSVFTRGAAKTRPSIQFMGVGRYGMKPKTAELRVEIRSPLSPRKAGEGTSAPKSRFWIPHDGRPLERTCEAVNAARRLTDTVLLDTKNPSGFIAGLPAPAGEPIII